MPAHITLPNAADVIGLAHVYGPDDFQVLNTALWGQSGGALVAGAVGGQVAATTAASDNAPAHLVSVGKPFAFADGKKCRAEALIKFTEAGGSAGVTNFFFGFTNIATGTLQLPNDGAGPPADWHGAGFFSLDGSDKLQVESAVGTAHETNVLEHKNRNNITGRDILASSAAWRRFMVETEELGTDDFHVNFFLDNEHVAQHRLQSVSSPTSMGLMLAIKSGTATAQAATIDWIYGAANR